MAKIKYSALVSDMRNKLNGSVLSKNRYGSYMRNKVTPVNPQTSYQQAQRANLSSMSTAWRGLTDEQRGSWQALAQNLPLTDIFGDTKILSGNALFVKLNLNLLAVGSPSITDAPQTVNVPNVVPSALNISVTDGSISTLEFAISPATVPAGFKLAVFATPAYSPGITFVKNKYRLLGTFTPTAGTIDIAIAWGARFGGANAGDKISISVLLVSSDTGQQGLANSISGIATL